MCFAVAHYKIMIKKKQMIVILIDLHAPSPLYCWSLAHSLSTHSLTFHPCDLTLTIM